MKNLILTTLLAWSSFTSAALINLSPKTPVKASEINHNFKEVKDILALKNLNFIPHFFSSGELISKDSLEAEFDKLRAFGLTIPVLPASKQISAEDLNLRFSQMISSASSLPAGIVITNNVRTYFDGTTAASCKDYLNKSEGRYFYHGSTGSGQYLVKPGSGNAFTVYCDMETDGGGWTLYYSQATGGYQMMLSKNAATVIPTVSGSHAQLNRIFEIATESRWTDTSLNKFIWFSVYASEYATQPTTLSTWRSALETKICNSGDPTVWMRFSNGYLNTGSKARKMESCKINGTATFFGFRNNMEYSSFRDVVNNYATHECWRDENAADRVFAWHNGAIAHGQCNQFGYNWAGKGSARGGSMNYLMWAR